MAGVYTQEQVCSAISAGLYAYYSLARMSALGQLKTMNFKAKRDVVRALGYMYDVAKNPALHFSRAATEGPWRARAKKFVKEKGVLPDKTGNAYYFVQDPTGVVAESADSAFRGNAELNSDFYRFCCDVQRWEYYTTSEQVSYRASAQIYADAIINAAADVCALVDIKKSNVFVRPFKQMIYSWQH